MRFYISADIEGIPGVVTREQGRAGGFEYEQARTWMTDSVLAVCTAAHEQGVEEVVVSDSHGNGHNLQLERMPDYVQLVRSWPRPLGMMQGIEVGEYVGAALVGYHAGSEPFAVIPKAHHPLPFTASYYPGDGASRLEVSKALFGEGKRPGIII